MIYSYLDESKHVTDSFHSAEGLESVSEISLRYWKLPLLLQSFYSTWTLSWSPIRTLAWLLAQQYIQQM